jgi:hypothetical protein
VELTFTVFRITQEYQPLPPVAGQPPARLPVWIVVLQTLASGDVAGQVQVRYTRDPRLSLGQTVAGTLALPADAPAAPPDAPPAKPAAKK